ncbi:MAG TPA: hypothetical protein VMV48_04000 [Gallionellaceae bacterium]|nr:hypothetical protein [Gallionellaceae bacterium]
MGNVIKLNTVRRSRLQDKAKAATLCGSGFHKWKTVIDSRFDVRQGRLVTTERCERCHEERTVLK